MVDVELHVVGIEAAVVVGGGEEGRIGEVGEVVELSCGKGRKGLLLRAAKLVDDEDVDLLKVLHEGVEIVELETAACVVATLDETGERQEGSGLS